MKDKENINDIWWKLRQGRGRIGKEWYLKEVRSWGILMSSESTANHSKKQTTLLNAKNCKTVRRNTMMNTTLVEDSFCKIIVCCLVIEMFFRVVGHIIREVIVR